MTVQIVQFTDTHLFADPERALRGVCTLASFRRCIAAARDDDWPPDAIVLTGDLAQDAEPGAYIALREALGVRSTTVYALPGNHDDPLAMQTLLVDDRFRYCGTHQIGPHWAMILLDSTIPGEVGGALTDAQIEALDLALRRHADRHCLVLLHHQPVPMGSAWIDADPLINADAFFATLGRRGNARGVLFGHVHQATDRLVGDIRVLSTPSTCGQFLPGSDTFAVDTRPPAFRRLALRADGSIDTVLIWLDA